MSELKSKTINGLFWTISQQFGVQAINFGVSIILARLLLPEEFGLIGIVSIFIAFGKVLVEGGLADSLIRTKNPDQIDYSSVFFTNLVFAGAIYVLIFFASPWISIFFEKESLTDLIRVYCLIFFVNAFSIVQSSKLNKEMNFKLQLLINLPSLISSGVLGITLALYDFGVWSIVWMNLFRAIVVTVQLWIWGKWVPTFVFNKERMLHHIKFGYKVSVSKFITAGGKNVNNIIIGKLFLPEILGFFTRAKTMQELPMANITNALKKVSFPMFAAIHEDEERTKTIFLKIVQQVFFFITPVLFTLIIVAEPLFRFLLTDKWVPSVPYFQILCLAGIFTPLNYYYLNILLVKGKSNLYLKLESMQNIMLLSGTLLVFPFGIFGLLWGMVATSFLMVIVYAYFGGRTIKLSMREQVKSIYPILFTSVFSGILTFFLSDFVKGYFLADWLHLLCVTLFSITIYLTISRLFKIKAMNDLIDLYYLKKNV